MKKMIKKGLVRILLLFLLSPFPARAATLCSCSDCPVMSSDLVRLTEFSVTGSEELQENDELTVKFSLQNYGQAEIAFGPQGAYLVARNPDSETALLGSSFADQTIKPMEQVNFETSVNLDKAGEWGIWPSYQIKTESGTKTGPEEWQICYLSVEAGPIPSSTLTLTPELSPVPPSPTVFSPSPLPLLEPSPFIEPPPAPAFKTGFDAGFSFIDEGPVMSEAVADGDEDGVLNYLDECPNTYGRLREHVFENGCVCIDTDGGYDYEQQGEISLRDRDGEEHSYQDYCSEDRHNVIEYSCDPDYELGRLRDAEPSDFRHIHFCGEDYHCLEGRCVLRSGVGVEPAICFSREGGAMEGTCADGIQNLNEEGIDCGGICPPCNTRCETEVKYAPPNTPCTSHYSTDLHRIDWPWTDSNIELICQLVEVCHPDLDYIVEEATRCCSLVDEAEISTMPDINLCREARELSSADCDVYYPWSTCSGLCRRCVSLYIIKGLGRYARWMQGYVDLYEEGAACEGGSCALGTEQAPSEMLVNYFSTGICRDYAQVLTTLLRKAGLVQASVSNFCDGRHCYNLVRLPGDAQWHIVDTTDNDADINLGGLPAGYPYCFALDENNWCFDGVRSSGESCESGFVGEYAGREYDFDAETGPNCRPGLSCVRDLFSIPGWAPTIEDIISCD